MGGALQVELRQLAGDFRATGYDRVMTMTVESRDARVRLDAHAQGIDEIFRRYGAVNPRLFGSVARGEATSRSDIDVLIDLVPGWGNDLLRIAGLSEELGDLLGCRVDVVTASILRDGVAETALADAVPL